MWRFLDRVPLSAAGAGYWAKVAYLSDAAAGRTGAVDPGFAEQLARAVQDRADAEPPDDAAAALAAVHLRDHGGFSPSLHMSPPGGQPQREVACASPATAGNFAEMSAVFKDFQQDAREQDAHLRQELRLELRRELAAAAP